MKDLPFTDVETNVNRRSIIHVISMLQRKLGNLCSCSSRSIPCMPRHQSRLLLCSWVHNSKLIPSLLAGRTRIERRIKLSPSSAYIAAVKKRKILTGRQQHQTKEVGRNEFMSFYFLCSLFGAGKGAFCPPLWSVLRIPPPRMPGAAAGLDGRLP